MIATATSSDRKHLEESFELGETNMQLEGFRPTSDPVYQSLKAEVLAGKLTFDEAVDAAVQSIARERRDPAA